MNYDTICHTISLRFLVCRTLIVISYVNNVSFFPSKSANYTSSKCFKLAPYVSCALPRHFGHWIIEDHIYYCRLKVVH